MNNHNGGLSSLERVEAFELAAARLQALEGIASLDITGLAVGVDLLREAVEGGMERLTDALEREDPTPVSSPFQNPLPEPDPVPPVAFIDADNDTEPLDWPGEWAPGEEGRIWLASGQGEYTLLAGLPGKGKSHFAQELGAREREAGGHPLAILPEAANSWRHRNRQLPPAARVHIVFGVPDLRGLRQALTERHNQGRPWPTLIVVDPATLCVVEWTNNHSEAATYSYPVVAAAVAALAEAVESPDGDRPKLIWSVHTPEGEQGGRGKRAVGGYTQAAGVGYLLPEVGKVHVLKPPRDCPKELPASSMLYGLDNGRISYIGQATRDLDKATGRILDFIGEAGEWGVTERSIRDALKGIGRVTVSQALPALMKEQLVHEREDKGVTGQPVTYYTTIPPTSPTQTQFNTPDEAPF